jgi:hypothetical protein
VNPPRSAGDGRQEIQLTAMVPIELPVVGNHLRSDVYDNLRSWGRNTLVCLMLVC